MTIYRLPTNFGGTELPGERDGDVVRFHQGEGSISFPLGMVTEVAPPMPPEPEEGAVVQVGNVVLIRRTFPVDGPRQCWRATNDEDPWMWEDICSRGAPVRLVPDPAATAPALPWRVDAVDAVSLLVDRHGVDDVWARDGDAYIQLVAPGAGSVSRRFTAEESRNLAAVLLSAAADTEAGKR